jgi:tetratricopeptide (TPR) repeat protein
LFASLGRWKDAVPCLERARRLAPTVLHGLHLGQTLLWLERLDEAEQVLRDSLLIDSQSRDVKETLVHVLSRQDRYEQAVTLAQDLCAAEPVAVSSRVAFACVLGYAGRLEEALHEAYAAAEADPSDPTTHAALAGIHVQMNNGAAALRALDQASSCIEKSTVRLPESVHVWSAAARGDALSLLGRHEEALSAFKEALRRDPEYFERTHQGRSHYERSLRESHCGTTEIGK